MTWNSSSSYPEITKFTEKMKCSSVTLNQPTVTARMSSLPCLKSRNVDPFFVMFVCIWRKWKVSVWLDKSVTLILFDFVFLTWQTTSPRCSLAWSACLCMRVCTICADYQAGVELMCILFINMRQFTVISSTITDKIHNLSLTQNDLRKFAESLVEVLLIWIHCRVFVEKNILFHFFLHSPIRGETFWTF